MLTKNQKILNSIISCLADQSGTENLIDQLKTKLTSSAGTLGITKVGLINLGQTCYMNSVLQALFRLPEFASSVLQLKVYSAGKVADELKGLLLASLSAHFQIGTQQDAAEYLRYN